jgi:hypothetical protein
MKKVFIAMALICAPLSAIGQDQSVPVGVGNPSQHPSGLNDGNTAATYQLGSNNVASIRQNGRRNVAVVAQIGADHVRTVEQNGNNLGYGSVQVTNRHYTATFSGHGGNAITSTTLDFDVTN